MANARSVAVEVVRRVVEQGAYSNLAVPAALSRSGLAPVDRNLAAELAYGTLRRLLRIDRALEPLVTRPLDTAPHRALALLRVGAYQVLFTRIPPHAAVSETVALSHPRERGFVNAVLRRLATNPPSVPEGDTDGDISARTGLVPWAVGELRRLLGDEAERAAAALGERAPLTIRVNTCRASVEDVERALAERGLHVTHGSLHPGSLLLDGGVPTEMPGFGEGLFAVQDQASSFVVTALDPRPGERVFDACAGPGGKTGHIACLTSPGGTVVGADSSTTRAGLVRRTVARLGLEALVLAQDARRPALAGVFDRVLVDAPCSGIGAARRRPELLWRPRVEDLTGLARSQVAILSSAVDLLVSGGRLVYSVCTFPVAETDGVCDELLRTRPDLAPAAIEGPEGRAERVRLWPHRHGSDAMFIAAFRRVG